MPRHGNRAWRPGGSGAAAKKAEKAAVARSLVIDDGWTVADAARETGLSTKTVRKHVKASGPVPPIGHPTVLLKEQEELIVSIFDRYRRLGWPVGRKLVVKMVSASDTISHRVARLLWSPSINGQSMRYLASYDVH